MKITTPPQGLPTIQGPGAHLRLQGVGRRFGGLQALDSLDLQVRPGELLSVIGPNGAGKSTLINLVTAQDRPDTGHITLDGLDLAGQPPQALARHGLARTFQHGRIFGNLSVLDNVLVGAHARLGFAAATVPLWGALREAAAAAFGWPSLARQQQGLREEAEALIALFGDRLWPRRHEPAHRLSYANRRRVELARALASHPRLLLLDEPTAGMNPTETDETFSFIQGLHAQGLSILLVEHKLDQVMRVSDTVVVLDHGRLIAEGPPHQVRQAPQVLRAYLGADHLGQHPAPDHAARGSVVPAAPDAAREAWA